MRRAWARWRESPDFIGATITPEVIKEVRRIAHYRCYRTPDLVDDIQQEALIHFWRYFDAKRGGAIMFARIATIRAAATLARREERYARPLTSPPWQPPRPDESAIARDTARRLLDGVAADDVRCALFEHGEAEAWERANGFGQHRAHKGKVRAFKQIKRNALRALSDNTDQSPIKRSSREAA